MGKILWVDLGSGRIQEEEIGENVYRAHLSGTGLAARILLDRIPPKADPLGPDNIICFVSGLLTGTGTLFTGRWMVAGKSPLTGTWGDANCGGNFSPAIKRCGYDGIFLRASASVRFICAFTNERWSSGMPLVSGEKTPRKPRPS
jgi:aldehyde:ferredoxin oxidoreductase